MNRYLLLGIAVLMLVVSVSGVALDFQNTPDFSEQVIVLPGITGGTGGVSWTHNTTGGNSYIYTSSFGSCSELFGGAIANADGIITTYSAATILTGTAGTVTIALYDSAKTRMGGANIYFNGTALPFPARVEFFSNGVGGTVYVDGVFVGDITGAGITQHPHYIGWQSGYTGIGGCAWSGDSYYDDMVWGTTESRFIFGMPETGYFLMKDVLNPAANGFYRVNQTNPNGTPTLITSNTFTSTFGKNSGTNETVTLSSPTGGSGLTYSTGTAYAGSIQWNLTQFFSQSTTGYGLYRTEINPQTNSPGFATSDWIPYIGSGATIAFDKNSYAVGETATLTVTISDAYYDVITSPHVIIQDIFGTEVVDDTTITFTQAMNGDWVGTSTYTWTDAEAEGVYFGMIYATYSGADVLMNYDTADLSSTLVVSGYVKDAETTNVISGATVNVTQGSTTDSLTSGVDGNYTSVSAFTANAPTTIVASKSGYETYQHVFTPLAAGSIQINLTLMPTSPTYTGIALGGIARTPPYNRTIDSALVTITNTSAGTYTATTNSAGYYIQNSMPNGSVWNIWGSKIGFSNSSIYQKLVVGI